MLTKMPPKKRVLILVLLLLSLIMQLFIPTAAGAEPPASQGVVDPLTPYTSERFYADIAKLAELYPDVIDVSSIGNSVLGKELTLVKLGTGNRSILWIGSIHSREVVTTAYLMMVIEEYARAYSHAAAYGEYSLEKVRWLLDEFTVYIVPMSNPDGVDIVTADGDANISVPSRSDFKSNANGVNLNKNFPFDWANNLTEVSQNNYDNYRGPSAASEPETRALIALCESVGFEHMVSCHVQGQTIYYRDNKNGVIPGDDALVDTISQITGFSVQRSTTRAASGWAGGFENWFRYRYNRPGVCLEFCRSSSASSWTMANFYESNMMDWKKSRYLLLGVLDSMSSLTAYPSGLNIKIGGIVTVINAYSIGGTNFVDIRDLAGSLNGTDKQFKVRLGSNNRMFLSKGEPYRALHRTTAARYMAPTKPVPYGCAYMIDDEALYLKTCRIRGTNYVLLSDICKALDIATSWSIKDKAVVIYTDTGYERRELE